MRILSINLYISWQDNISHWWDNGEFCHCGSCMCVELLDTILNWWGLKISWLCLCINMAKEFKNYELWFLFHYFLFFLLALVCMYWNEPKPCVHVSLLSAVLYAKQIYMLWCNATRTLFDGLMLLLCILTYGNLYCYRFIMDHLTNPTLVMRMQKDLSIFKTS